MTFKLRGKVLIRSIPSTMTSFRKSLGKLPGKQATITDHEVRYSGQVPSNYYLVSVEGKELWLHELNLEVL